MDALVLPGTLDSLEGIAAYVLDAARAAGLDRRATYRLRLAVDEVVTNMIVHGYQEARLTGDVLVQARLDEDVLTIAVEDKAAPFDPRSQIDPAHLHLPLEERPIGGLGIFLAMKGVDSFDYAYVDQRNRYTLSVKRPTADPNRPAGE